MSLKPGAFDYLDLPFEVRGGRVGRLVARIPWRAPRAGRAALAVELTGVEVVACPRPEADWEEGAAGARALAAKRAALAAAEAERVERDEAPVDAATAELQRLEQEKVRAA